MRDSMVIRDTGVEWRKDLIVLQGFSVDDHIPRDRGYERRSQFGYSVCLRHWQRVRKTDFGFIVFIHSFIHLFNKYFEGLICQTLFLVLELRQYKDGQSLCLKGQ